MGLQLKLLLIGQPLIENHQISRTQLQTQGKTTVEDPILSIDQHRKATTSHNTRTLIIQESAKNHPRTINPTTEHTTIQQYTHKISLSNRLLQKLKEKTHLEIKPKS
jgi:hypothetical protein